MKSISSTVLTILLVLSVLLAGCNSGSFKSSCFIAKDSRLTEQDKLLVAGSYKLKSIGGMSPEDYYKNLASNSDSDPDVERTWHTEEELNARIEQVSLLILNPDGTAFYPSFLGGYLSGEWYREGEDVFVTVYGTGFEGTGTIESHTVVLKDSVFQLKGTIGEFHIHFTVPVGSDLGLHGKTGATDAGSRANRVGPFLGAEIVAEVNLHTRVKPEFIVFVLGFEDKDAITFGGCHFLHIHFVAVLVNGLIRLLGISRCSNDEQGGHQ